MRKVDIYLYEGKRELAYAGCEILPSDRAGELHFRGEDADGVVVEIGTTLPYLIDFNIDIATRDNSDEISSA
jgi:hypothetical protein